MLVFNNQQRSGYEEIVSYSPKFYLQIKEMDAIFRFAGFTLDLMAEDLEQLVRVQFVMNMEEEQIEMYERICKIHKTGTLDQRRRNVYSYLFGSGKLSGSKIEKIISVMFGGNTEVTVEMGIEVLEIKVAFSGNDDSAHIKLKNFLDRVLPAHLVYLPIYEKYISGTIHNGVLWHDAEILEIRQVVL